MLRQIGEASRRSEYGRWWGRLDLLESKLFPQHKVYQRRGDIEHSIMVCIAEADRLSTN